MCGIWAVLGEPIAPEAAKNYVQRLKARGPEGSRILDGAKFQLGFTRLAINGLNEAGMQPMSNKNIHWICNGELYNWKDLVERFNLSSLLKSGSDCEMLGHLFEVLGGQTDAPTIFRSLDGVFSTVIINEKAGMAFVARDPYGIRPLYVGYELMTEQTNDASRARVMDASGALLPIKRIVFASEMKAIPTSCSIVEPFPPGHYAAYELNTLQRIGFEPYHTVPWLKNPALETVDSACDEIQIALMRAVQKRLMTERPIAALLSGGLDSSLIAALVQRFLEAAGSPHRLKTFSIGFEGSEDLKYARMVADHIKSDHTELIMTPDEFFAAIPDVIHDIESFDITTVRASVGNWLISREIAKRTDCKVVFNGDGSDEVFGGYMYFYKAPSDEAFEAETSRLLQDIHMFDVLRSDRSISSHGLEARTPFLDKQFVAVAKSIASKLRRPIQGSQCEKFILRQAFADTNLLPQEVLWRKKEAFSDGVSAKSKSWYQICQEKALEEVGDDWKTKASLYTHLPPQTAEAFYYRTLWDRFYHSRDLAVVPYYWMPRWSPGATDPSARTLDVYNTTK